MNFFNKEDPTFAPRVIVDETPAFSWIPHTISFLRRRWPVVAIGFAVCVTLGLAYILATPPIFTAETDVLIDIRRADLLSQQHSVQDAQTLNAVLESQVEILRSEGLAGKVVSRLDLVNDPLFNQSGFSLIGWVRGLLAHLRAEEKKSALVDRQAAAAERFQGMTSVRRIGLTYVIDITVKSPSPELSARLANSLVDAYIVDQLAAQEDTTKQATIWLQDRLSELKDQAVAADTVVQRYKSEKGIVETDKGLMNEQQLAELTSQLLAAKAHSSEMRSRLERITAIMRGDMLDATVADGLQNTIINDLRKKYLEDVQLETQWAAKYGPDHSAVIKIRADMDTLKKEIRNELGQIEQSYRSDYAVAHADEVSAEARMTEMLGLTSKTNGDRVALRSLQSSAETYRSVYQNFLQRYTQAVQDQSFPVSEARVITAAKPPLRKSWPRSNLVLGGAGFIGIGLGFAVALLRETMDRGIRTTGQLRMVTGLNCIGLLPRLRRRRRVRGARIGREDGVDVGSRILSDRSEILRHVLHQPNSRFSEAIRALGVRICRGHQRAGSANLIGCVSAQHGEGASTTAANLAQILTKAGSRTLLVDWASGPGSLSQTLAPGAKLGFLDLLAGTAKLDELVWSDPETGMHFLPAGARPSRVITTLINSPHAQDVRTELLREYEYVVFDVPELSPVVEMHTATQLVDAFVLVVAWGRADPDSTVGALTDAELDDRRFLGAVLNGVDLREYRLYPGNRIAQPIAALT